MKLVYILVALAVGCSHAPEILEPEKSGFRHTPSQVYYPKDLGQYSFYQNDVRQALKVDPKSKRKSAALYVDYKSGGMMTSILYRPFAKVETFPRPRKIKFDTWIKNELKNLSARGRVLSTNSARAKDGGQIWQVRMETSEAFMSYSFLGEGLNEKIPAITKYVYIEKGAYVVAIQTAYPLSESAEVAKANALFVDAFIQSQVD